MLVTIDCDDPLVSLSSYAIADLLQACICLKTYDHLEQCEYEFLIRKIVNHAKQLNLRIAVIPSHEYIITDKQELDAIIDE